MNKRGRRVPHIKPHTGTNIINLSHVAPEAVLVSYETIVLFRTTHVNEHLTDLLLVVIGKMRRRHEIFTEGFHPFGVKLNAMTSGRLLTKLL